MRRFIYMSLALTLLPAGLSGQQAPVDRLRDVLPADVAEQVIQHVESAGSQALPANAVANLALEGVAKGRSAVEVLDAVEELVRHLSEARDALSVDGRPLQSGEVEAAATAMRMGVDGASVRELARSQPSGRSLAVPLFVVGGLTGAGVAAEEALGQVLARLAARADDAALLRGASEMAPGMAPGGGMPGQLGAAIATGMAGFQVPVSGMNVPVGPPDNVPGRPGSLPGRGNPQGPGMPGGPGGGA